MLNRGYPNHPLPPQLGLLRMESRKRDRPTRSQANIHLPPPSHRPPTTSPPTHTQPQHHSSTSIVQTHYAHDSEQPPPPPPPYTSRSSFQGNRPTTHITSTGRSKAQEKKRGQGHHRFFNPNPLAKPNRTSLSNRIMFNLSRVGLRAAGKTAASVSKGRSRSQVESEVDRGRSRYETSTTRGIDHFAIRETINDDGRTMFTPRSTRSGRQCPSRSRLVPQKSWNSRSSSKSASKDPSSSPIEPDHGPRSRTIDE